MTAITIIGNLVDAPELRYTAQGKAVVNFAVAEQERVRDGDGWKDGPTTFWRCTLWDTPAENMAESLSKGQRVVVVGEARQRTFETRDGETRTVIEITASEVAPSLRWATCKVTKTTSAKAAVRKKPAAEDDPWAAGPATDEPPF